VDPPEVLAQLRAATGAMTGLVVVNPPYGKRLGTTGEAARLVRALGRTLRPSFPGWRAAVLLPDVRWASALGLTGVQRHPLRNGGLRIHLWWARCRARPRLQTRGGSEGLARSKRRPR
jgi:putative N6-adenine-specific DNA methylase